MMGMIRMITSVRLSRMIWMNSLRMMDANREFMGAP
jgi:hypothetical protein